MRGLVREAGLEDEFEIDSAGTGSWHAGDPPDRRATAAAKARGVTLEGAARQVRPRDFEHYDLLLAMDRENLRELRTFSADGDAAGKARLLREFDPASAGAPDLDVPDPYYGGPDGFEKVLDQVEAACRGLLEELRRGEPRAALVRAATGREVRAVERVGGGDINEAFRVQFADESFGFVKTRADVAPGEYAAEAAGLRWLAEPGALRVPEVLGVGDEVLVLDWVDEGGRGDDAAFGAGLAEVHAAGADAFGATPAAGAPRRWPAAGGAAPAPPAASPRVALAPQRPHARLAHVLRRAAPAAVAPPRRPHALRQPCGRARLRPDGGARRAARAARAAARRPVERERAVGARRHARG